jgi:NAD(P)-dependent dehydrogenase (short-subunit alcohol dehydrogenase family)
MTTLITGANSGFGLLATELFARAGHPVAAGYRDPARAEHLFALANAGLPITPVQLDVTVPAQIEAAAAQFGDVTALVNNAGFGVRGPVEHISDETYRQQFETNVLGVIRMVRAFAPQMRARRAGAIVNISSLAGVVTLPFSGIYAASKHAVEALSEAMYMELRPFGIRVALIEPGIFPTGFTTRVRTAPEFDAASPYAAFGRRYGQALTGWIAESASQSPALVAQAILRAVTNPATPFRQVLGPDAERLVPAYRSQDFEDFAAATLAGLGLPGALDPPPDA